jgi:hypothetical protein
MGGHVNRFTARKSLASSIGEFRASSKQSISSRIYSDNTSIRSFPTVMIGALRHGFWIPIGTSCRSLGWRRSWRRSWICYWKKLCTQLLALLRALLCTICTRSLRFTTAFLAKLLLPDASIPANIPTSRVPSPIVSSPSSRLPVKSEMSPFGETKTGKEVMPVRNVSNMFRSN